MKLATIECDGRVLTAAVTPDGMLLDLAAAAPVAERVMFASMLAIVGNEAVALGCAADLLTADRGDHLHAPDTVRFLAPLPVPNSIRDFANFELHCLQALETSMRTRAASQPDPEAAYRGFKASGAYDLPAIWYDRPFYFKGNRKTPPGWIDLFTEKRLDRPPWELKPRGS